MTEPFDVKKMIENIKISPAMKDVSPFSEAEMEAFRIGGEFKRKFLALGQAGRIRFDWNGHHKRRYTTPTFPPSYTWEFRKEFGLEESVMDGLAFLHGDVEAAKKTLALFDAHGDFLPFHKCTYTAGCYQCGQDVELGFNGVSVKALSKCKYPDGMPPITALVNVPSGKLIFANYFGDVPRPKGEKMGVLGYKQDTLHYAKHNVAYGFCGNSCPSIWISVKKDKLIIGNPAYEEATMEDIPNPFAGYRHIGSVTTDLWAWSATCADTWKTFDDQSRSAEAKVIPGRYRVSQMFHRCDYDNHKIPRKFATIERVGRS